MYTWNSHQYPGLGSEPNCTGPGCNGPIGQEGQVIFTAKRKVGKHGHWNGDPGQSGRVGSCHTQRWGYK